MTHRPFSTESWFDTSSREKALLLMLLSSAMAALTNTLFELMDFLPLPFHTTRDKDIKFVIAQHAIIHDFLGGI
jgi:hypothetical protein